MNNGKYRTVTRVWGDDKKNYSNWMEYKHARRWVERSRDEHGHSERQGARFEYWLEDENGDKVL